MLCRCFEGAAGVLLPIDRLSGIVIIDQEPVVALNLHENDWL